MMAPVFPELHLESRPYTSHPGSLAGNACTFELAAPVRTKSIPYSYLVSVDTLGESLITLRYSFADVTLSLSRDFPGKRQFVDDLANFRVSSIREGKWIRISITMEPDPEKTEKY